MIKRLFDITFSFIGLIILLPLFIVVALLIKLDSKGPVFFLQERVGRDFKDFNIYKFRSMKTNALMTGPQITVSGDSRITKVGQFIRRYKIDELPQLINVLKGDMSFVGPRPEVRKYVDKFKSEYATLLVIRPGITDPASIEYKDEETVLSSSDNWEEAYIKIVLPEKIRLSIEYINNMNIVDDIILIIRTLFKIS